MPNISIVWDFDGTLTPVDSTTVLVEFLTKNNGTVFWDWIHSLRGDGKSKNWEYILASDAPIWMYALSKIAYPLGYPLNAEFFRKYIVDLIKLYPNCLDLLMQTKELENSENFQSVNLKIHHFIVSAGLKELVEQFFPKDVMTWVFGCRYSITALEGKEDQPESIPVFCMDETMKTRSLFEIAKGSFSDEKQHVNKRIDPNRLWCPFENIIYVGDGPTDIPALSLTRDRGGMGAVIYNPAVEITKRNKRIRDMRLDKRADIITPADFSKDGELYNFISVRCHQIRQRYEAEKID